MTQNLLAGCGLLAIAIAMRTVPARLFPRFAGTDLWFHLSYAAAIRANGHRVPAQDPRIVGPGRLPYPALMHVLLSLMPARVVRFLCDHGAVVLDLVCGSAAAIALGQLQTLTQGELASLTALYILSPALTLVDIGPATFTISPRVLARTLYGLVTLGFIVGSAPGPGVVLGLSVLLALTLLTSKFAIQQCVAIPILGLILGRGELLVVGALGICVAQLISGGFFRRQLVGQREHLRWYWRKQRQYLYKTASPRSIASALRKGSRRGLVEGLLLQNPISSGLARHPQLFAAVACVARPGGDSAPLSNSDQAALGFCLAALVLWIVTSIGPFRIFGEAERYLQMALPASWLLFWSKCTLLSRDQLIVSAFFLFAFVYAASVSVELRHSIRRSQSDLEEAMDQIAATGEATVLSLDVTESYAFLARPNVRICMYNGQQTLVGDAGRFLEAFLLRYPWVSPSRVDALVRDMGVTHIVRRRAIAEAGGPDYDLSEYKQIAENAGYLVYAVTKA